VVFKEIERLIKIDEKSLAIKGRWFFYFLRKMAF
jgi:hypothetical protein